MAERDGVTVLVPAPLRRFTGGEAKVTAGGATVGEVIDDLEARYPGIKGRICEADGRIRRFVNVFVNGANVRSADGASTAVEPGDEVGIVPAMAGGCWRTAFGLPSGRAARRETGERRVRTWTGR